MRRRALGPSICRVWRCPSLEIESWAAGQLPELRRALTRSLLEHMVDMSAGYCDTGCVQRILYCVDGVDLTLERKVISRYQGKRPIDEGLSIRLKQDMLEAAVVADLVERRGWSAAAVRPELDRMKAFMNDL